MQRITILPAMFLFFTLMNSTPGYTQTIALWLFDEPQGIYPSSVMDDASDNDYPLVIGPGGQIVKGKFGNALAPLKQPDVKLPSGEVQFGLSPAKAVTGRTVEPMNWMNANFCALMTSGENHLRKEVGFVNATQTKLNLGGFNWTVEFWFKPSGKTAHDGCVFEIGEGPRGENQKIIRLKLNQNLDGMLFENTASGISEKLKFAEEILNSTIADWHHVALVYSFDKKNIQLYIDGNLRDSRSNIRLNSLDVGQEAYMSIGRDGAWQQPLQGAIDELKFSEGALYQKDFIPPQSFSVLMRSKRSPIELKKGPPLLFAGDREKYGTIELMDRKHLFIDDALIEKKENIVFTVNPPKWAERVIDKIEGPFRKHLTVVEDEEGVIRIYNSIHDDFLAVRTSKDGIHFESPDMDRGEYRGQKNIVIHEMVGGLGNPFIDPNGPPERRWKYITGYHRRGIYVYTSADGFTWVRHKTALLPFRSGTQSCTFYDDQRQLYVSYHRTGIFETPAGATQRSSVLTETKDLFQPIPYKTLTPEDYREADKILPLREPLPWYLDNGPLTPGGFGLEFPHKFNPIDADPVGTDIYITKAQKYPWAPDTYLAFPIVYFHYELDGPPTRQILMDPARGRGSGPVETQLSVSRDGIDWQRFSRPTYVGVGNHEGRDVYTAYIAHGMVKRGDEIWQYYFGENQYHSAWKDKRSGNAVYRLVQRLDGFVSVDSPYDREATMITRPLIFKGNRLVLNIDTDATGYVQVGFLDKDDHPIEGFSVDDCIYINGDFIDTEVEWFPNWKDFREFEGKKLEEIAEVENKFIFTKDVSSLEGKEVKIVFRMRGSKLYAMQFLNK